MGLKVLLFLLNLQLITFFENQLVIDLQKIESERFVKVPIFCHIRSIKLVVYGHGEYPKDLEISLYKDDRLVFATKITDFECPDDYNFKLEAKIDYLKGLKKRGRWKLVIEDKVEDDENTIERAYLVIK